MTTTTFSRRRLTPSEQLSIYGWRLAVYATRLLYQGKVTLWPIVGPVRYFLWVPVAALMFGVVLGWVIARL